MFTTIKTTIGSGSKKRKKRDEEIMEKVVGLENTNQYLVEDGSWTFFEGANHVLSYVRETAKALYQEAILNELTSYRAPKVGETSNPT